MKRTCTGSDHEPGDAPGSDRASARSTWGERAIVLGGFAIAALWTAASLTLDAGTEAIGPLWMAAVAWTVLASLGLALRRGIRRRGWSAFRRYRLSDNSDTIDWSTRTGAYAYMRIAEENERLMRGD